MPANSNDPIARGMTRRTFLNATGDLAAAVAVTTSARRILAAGAPPAVHTADGDEVCWMENAWPVKAEATGERHFRGKIDDQNFDNDAVEYTFGGGAQFFYYGRPMKHCEQKFGLFGQGSKGAFTISERGHSPAKSTISKGQLAEKENILWTAKQPEKSPYQLEWDHLVAAIIANEPYNEAQRGAEASLVTAMGRFAAHTGRTVTYDEMLNCTDDLTAGVDSLTDTSSGLLAADTDGTYPVPMPGKYKFEYRS